MKLTESFQVEEFEKSSTATKYRIDNHIPNNLMKNVFELAKVLQVIRNAWGKPIIINSGYRCPVLNLKVGGAINSLHCSASAADFSDKDKSKNGELFKLIQKLMKEGKITCRTLIWEKGNKKYPSWIHLDIQDGKHTERKNHVVYYYSK